MPWSVRATHAGPEGVGVGGTPSGPSRLPKVRVLLVQKEVINSLLDIFL